MNCANHPETPATAFCQYCGKPLCAECVHKVNDIVSCEPCLAARVQGAYNVGIHSKGFHYTASGPLPPGSTPPHPPGADPWVAFGLGFIPGVGAMYNGQFAKGIAHVLIFVMLVELTHVNGLLGIVVAAWVIYQIFDAYQTALARRAGLPLPNPLGLNDVGHWFGGRGHAPYPGVNPVAPNPPVPPPPPGVPEPGVAEPGVANPDPFPGGPVSGFTSTYTPPPYSAPPMPSMPPVPPNQYDTPDLWHRHGSGIPTGAVILIVLGVLFLLGNIGILSQHWLDRGWPILLIAIGVWIVIRRSHTPPPTGGAR